MTLQAGESPISCPSVSSEQFESCAVGRKNAYKDFLIEVQDSSSDFDPMPYDEDSGYAEAFPATIRHSHLSSSEDADSDTGFSQHLRDTPPRVRSVSTSSNLQLRSRNETEDCTRSTPAGAFSSKSERLSGHFTSDLLGLSDSDMPASLRNVGSADDRRELSFLERMVAKYPHVSASISSGRSSPRPSLSRLCYETPPRLCSPFSGVDGTPEFVSDIIPKNQGHSEDMNEAEKTTLLDAVAGRLFEDSNPWQAIKARLSGSPTGLESRADTMSRTGDAFVELQTATNRHGVGFQNIQPTLLAHASCIDSPQSPSPPSIYCSTNNHNHSELEARHDLSIASTPVLQGSLSSAQRQIPVQGCTDGSDTSNTLMLPVVPLIPSGNSEGRHVGTNDMLTQINGSRSPASRVSSPVATNRRLYVFATSPTGQEEACLQEASNIKTSPMISHSSPQDTCIMTSTRMISGLASASAVLPDIASAGDVREVQQAHRQEETTSTVPIQPPPKETFIVGPSLFDDESEDCDEL